MQLPEGPLGNTMATPMAMTSHNPPPMTSSSSTPTPSNSSPNLHRMASQNGGVTQVETITEQGKIPNTNGTLMPHDCAGCKSHIKDRYLLKALDQYWHEDCLKCSCCDCRLGEVGATLYTKANLLLCRRDYLRLFGTTGHCSACRKMIPAFELVMRAKGNVYHLECFACQQCNHRFCVGDRFYLCDNKILCEYDYEERMIFANMQYHNNNNNSSGYNALTRMKQQTESLSDSSSGYSSPSPGTL